MIIDVDIGNTRIKWQFADVPNSFAALDVVDGLPESWRRLSGRTRFRISSVVGSERTLAFTAQVAALGDAIVEIAAVKNPFAGVDLAYADVAKFGVDRWLALLAAKAKYAARDCVVIHAGTALVADFLRADGRHLGGFITPGWQTSLRSLGTAAHALNSIVARPSNLRRDHPGTATLECIEAGASLLFRGFLRELALTASAQLTSPKWIFTGGDAELLMSLRQLSGERFGVFSSLDDAEFARALVLEGLPIALP